MFNECAQVGVWCYMYHINIRALIQYKDVILHCEDKAILRQSYLQNGISYTRDANMQFSKCLMILRHRAKNA